MGTYDVIWRGTRDLVIPDSQAPLQDDNVKGKV